MEAKRFFGWAGASTLVVVLSACGGGGGGSGGDERTAPPATTISSSSQGSQAAAGATQSANVVTGGGSQLGGLGEIGLSALTAAPKKGHSLARQRAAAESDPVFGKAISMQNRLLAPRVKKAAGRAQALRAAKVGTQTVTAFGPDPFPCDSGSGSISGTFDDATNSITLTVTFVDCFDSFDGSTTNGTMTLSGTFTDGTSSFSGSMTLTFTNLTIVTGSETMTASLTMGSSFTISTSFTDYTDTYGFNANGTISFTDGVDSVSITYDAMDYSATERYAEDGSANVLVDKMTEVMDGGVTFAAVVLSVSVSQSLDFYDMTTVWDWTQWYTDFTTITQTINGTMSYSETPAACANGTYVIVTNTPITWDSMQGFATAGQLTINGNTVIVFNSDGSITVTVGANAPVNFTDVSDLEAECPISDPGMADLSPT